VAAETAIRPAHRPAPRVPRLTESFALQALILGVVEGITEFIPVSSTGHLILARDYLGYPAERFDVLVFVIQLAAIIAICLLYFGRLWRVLVDLPRKPEAQRFVTVIAVAFVPSVVLGLLLDDFMKRHLFSAWVVAAALLVGGLIILLVERLAHHPRFHDTAEVPAPTAFGIGLCQTMSMIPGVSRAGATIMGGVLLGLDRKAAAEFSFFLAIPTMLGASVLDLYKGWGRLDGSLALEIAVASLASFVTATVVVRAFVTFLGRHTFAPFGWYRIAAGAAMIGFLVSRGA
jgi:undecaprenyl-diphosphatase